MKLRFWLSFLRERRATNGFFLFWMLLILIFTSVKLFPISRRRGERGRACGGRWGGGGRQDDDESEDTTSKTPQHQNQRHVMHGKGGPLPPTQTSHVRRRTRSGQTRHRRRRTKKHKLADVFTQRTSHCRPEDEKARKAMKQS